ncbi:hypothetical protein PPYR_01310 [Photinus pyralis]|uniref:RING-type domain-containing protein n=1 Tax=Photinus pyralis TaxID=7054 RepID=A0A5N4B4Q6_PHOPY|nr:uncharacterized protein LOC116160032 [Photinus pyralis]KAB0804340.1 hypothetical protein PPYR_01310 [Photinus pyralis]
MATIFQNISAVTQCITSTCSRITNTTRAVWIQIFNGTLNQLKELCYEMHEIDLLLIRTNVLFSMCCQITFVTMLDALFTEKKISGVLNLLICSMLGLLLTRGRNMINSTSERQSNITEGWLPRYGKLTMELFRMVMLVIFINDERRMFHFNFVHTFLSVSYYMCTSYLFKEIFIDFAAYFKLSSLEAMEHLYVPIVLKSYALLLSITLSIVASFRKYVHFSLFASYFLIHLPLKDIYCNYVKRLIIQTRIYDSFKMATEEDIQQRDDVCPICLSAIEEAKVTSCNHFFHPVCLKNCLKTSLKCPLCKHQFF